jgi:hypothetical protein
MQGVGGGRLIEKDGDGARHLGKRVVRQNVGNFGRCPHQNADWLARVDAEAVLERRLHLGFGSVAGENHVAARDIGSNGCEACDLAHSREFAHQKLAGATDVDRAQESHENSHHACVYDEPKHHPAAFASYHRGHLKDRGPFQAGAG